MTATTTTTTARLYEVTTFDSRSGGTTYAAWTEGTVYAVTVGENILYTGVQNRLCKYYELVPNPENYDVGRKFWKEISFEELPAICIPVILQQFGPQIIPWAKTRWSTYEDYLEWQTPTTLEGKLKKALRKPSEFPKEELAKVSQVIFLGKDGSSLAYESKYLYQTPWGWYKYRIGYFYLEGYSYELNHITEEKAQEELLAKERRALEEQRSKKDYGRSCSKLSRKYGLPWKVVSIFKGNEEEIKKFLNTLKEAIELRKEFDSEELSCGRSRRRAEITRLGIDIAYVDPNRISGYILDCLESGAIQKEY